MSASRDAPQVRSMFDRIARGYDAANTVLSLGRDQAWRRIAADSTRLQPGEAALDIACGTGKLASLLRHRAGIHGRVVGVDFSQRMLAIARARDPAIEWAVADATSLPFPDDSFDAATIAFGLRNLAVPERGLEEMRRVVRSGGRLVVLEFLRPPGGAWGAAYSFYLRTVLPRVGGWIAGDPRAYRYLSDTVGGYLSEAQLVALAARTGWNEPRLHTLNLRTVALLTGISS